jgi:class 3 adenylate cyclase
MRGIGRSERLLAVLFFAIWLPAFALSVDSVWRHVSYASVLVKAGDGPSSHPVVTGFVSGLRGQESGLRVGDALLSVNGNDLAGAGPYTFKNLVSRGHGRDAKCAVTYSRDGAQGEASFIAGSYAMYWPRLLASLVFASAVLFLLLRVPSSEMVRAFALTYACAALFFACTFGGSVVGPGWGLAVHLLSLGVGAPLALRATLLFPDGRRPQGTLANVGPWFFALLAPLDVSRFFGFPFPAKIGAVACGLLLVVYVAICVGALQRAYHRADPVGRRRIKWFLVGVYWAVVPPVLAGVLAGFDARFAPVLVIGAASLALIPLFLILSITRYDLFDVDQVLSATASYTVLLVMVLAATIAWVPRLSTALALQTGVDAGTLELVLAGLMAAVIVPSHRLLHMRIDRIFFVERYALERGITDLVRDLSSCSSPEELTRTAGERLDRLLRPESCVIYTLAGDTFAPAFVRGRDIPPAFEARGPLVAALAEHAAPLAGREPFERAVLETLGVPMVVPVRRGLDLAAFVCLGPKLSGDLFTPTDRNLLSMVIEKVSGELQRFDTQQMLEASRRMQEKLRRYVPGALADRLDRDASLDVGECEVSVLFVDLRGYSLIAEAASPAQAFGTLSRYTEAVSSVVQAHGGTVVEFNGDGMMAVFGAPEPLPDKERAAAQAGEAIVATVRSLDMPRMDGQAEPLSVGVGIATGPAYVGSIRAVDRLIWTAIGDTTNLAARLQMLTRDLDAAMVIDAATWRAAGERARVYHKQEQAQVRGRLAPQDLYVLPLAAIA